MTALEVHIVPLEYVVHGLLYMFCLCSLSERELNKEQWRCSHFLWYSLTTRFLQ